MPSPRPVDSPPRPSAHSPLARSSRRGRVGASALPEARRAAWLAAVAVAVAVVAMVSPATAGRPNVLDNFLPPCPTLAEPTSAQPPCKKWSDLATVQEMERPSHVGRRVSAFPVTTLPSFPLLSPPLLFPPAYKKWSDLATWASGSIPGQGDAVGANVTIACGEAILLDTSPIALTLLNIRGFLR
ncbi:unnamed protein product, partial [Closterium sp. NIES-64]